MKVLEQRYVDVLDFFCWDINDYYGDNRVEITALSPGGEEIYINANVNTLSEDVYFEYDNFDVEDHVFELLEAKRNGLSGVPYITDLIKDAMAIQSMLENLAIALRQAEVEEGN